MSISRWPLYRSLLIGAILVVSLTYPTVPRATTVGRVDTNDGRFSIWNIAWIDHALLSDPRNLLNANIFWPHTGTIAYSELNLVAGVLGLPWYAATRSPLAALNGAVAGGLLLSFVLMAALVRRLTGSSGAGIVAATAFTFCPYLSSRTAHVQLLMVFVFPLVFLAYHRMAESGRLKDAVWLGAAIATAALASGYYGIFAGLAVGLLSLVLLPRREAVRAYFASLGLALATALVLVAPVFMVFNRARLASGAPSGPRAIEPGWSANISSYLASGTAAHEWWLGWLRSWQAWNDVLFPGIGLLVLAAAAIWFQGKAPGTPAPSTQHPAPGTRIIWAYLSVAVVSCWASFGPDLYLYRVLDTLVPGMSLLRAPARFGIVVAFALAVLAGFGAAGLARHRRWPFVVMTVLIAAELGVKTSAWGWPSWPLRTSPPVSPAYTLLAQLPRGTLVEFQFPYVSSNYHNHAVAMYWSTYHWQSLVNGYSDVVPPDFDAIALPINYFPDPASFDIMKARNVRYVLWHIDYYRGEGELVIQARLDKYARYLRPLVRTADTWLYEITAWP